MEIKMMIKIRNIQRRGSRYACINFFTVFCLVFVFSACSAGNYWHNVAIHYYPHTGKNRLPSSELAYFMLKSLDKFSAIKKGGNTVELREVDDYDVPPGQINGWTGKTIAVLPGEHTLVFLVTKYYPKGEVWYGNSYDGWGTRYKYTSFNNRITKTIEVPKGKHYLVKPTSSGKDVIIEQRIVE